MKRTFLATALVASATLFAASAIAAPTTYKIDPSHTVVLAGWSHFGFSHPVADFGQVDGAITYDPAAVGKSSVEVTIPLAGLDTHVPKLDEHLRSADFFDAAKYPTITFKSTKVEAAGKDKLKVTGDLTVKGKSHPAVLAVTINKVGEHPMSKHPTAGFDATTTLKRSDFGIDAYVPNVSDEITVRITTEASVDK